MADTVAHYCLNLSVASFVVFAIVTLIGLVKSFRSSEATTSTITSRGSELDPDSLTKLLEALSKVTDSFAKAGPGLAALVASILFASVAALSLPRDNSKAPTAPAAQADAGNKTAPAK